ncbi:DENN domain-containing protein 1B-like isoform X3 [Lytechinus variegatus]|uniref:DENN domain-containing protein 1B-like isoform X3 n=1 Tax=Lytechinus variegatus TaxID=7654 RepID=UPI001BB27F1F|nr:DENN domain-containing protein 1B-like isoform X3 [Lytechinus variegatus]
MGSRLKTNPDHLYEAFFEVAAPSDDNPAPHIVSTFPPTFHDEVAAKELPRFCFPCDLSRYNPAGQLFTFVLTGIDNLQRFGFCRHPPGAKTAICILSYLPWFDIFYKILNKLASLKNSCEPAATALLDQLHKVSVPGPGKQLRITVSEGGNTSEMLHTCPDDTRILPSIPENINMTEYFSAVTPENMIILFVSLLHERRVLITSEKLHRLTACVYGAVSMLHPLHWQHIYIPVTPSHLIDYCSAPMPFIIGVHSSFMEKVKKMALDEVVILDADNNSIETPFNDLQVLPSEAVTQLKHNLKNSSQVSGDGVARSFLKTLVYLLGSYREALTLENGEIVFDRDAFVSNGSRHELAFRNTVLQLQHFAQFVEFRVGALNRNEAIDDLFEEELDSRIASGSKIQENIRRRLLQAKAKSTVLYGKIKDKSRDAKDRVVQAQGNFKVPVTVNPQAVKDAFLQTKSIAGKRINTMKDKLKFKETEDILTVRRDHPEISRPITATRSTPSSPSSSPVLSRRKPTSASAQPKDRISEKVRGTRHYEVLEVDGSEEMTLEQFLRDDASLPARYSSMDLMPSVQPILNKFNASPTQKQSTEDDKVGEASGEQSTTPQPPARRKRDKKKQEDEISLRSNRSSSSSLVRMDLPSSDKEQGAGLQPLPPKGRPRNAPPPPPPTYLSSARHQSSSNNSNQCSLIDITHESPDSPIKCEFEDNFEPLVTLQGSAHSVDSPDTGKRKTRGTELLEEYGLFFDTLDVSQPSSLPVAPVGQESGTPMQSQQGLMPHPGLVRNSSGLADLLSVPQINVANSSLELSAPVHSVPSSNPFASSQPAVPHQPSTNPFKKPLEPTKSVTLSAEPDDPFAALVSIQKTNISPVSKDSPGIPARGPSPS